jgi:DNA polymerase-3 subunit alpha/error-prone DNA polymerase
MWGTASVQRICRRARRLGYHRLALTDTDNLYGLWPFLTACRREGLEPIVGAEVTDPQHPLRAICLVADADGYANLCRLLTRRHQEAGFRLASALPPLAKGLVVLTQDAAQLAAWHHAGVNVAAAMPRNPLSRSHPLRRQARALGVACVASPGTFFLDPAELETHRLLRAIDRSTSLSRLGPADTAPANAWLDSPAGYARRFAGCPQALADTVQLAEQLSFRGPAFGLVMPVRDGKAANSADRLRRAAYAGARRRYGDDLSEVVVERLENELNIIAGMNFSDYFLVVREIVGRSPRTCGRGSGAASLVAYCLQITNVCPVKHNLYFERFLNPGRTDAPDIDVDFAWDERDAILARVLSDHRGHAAMVANHVCFQPRMAIREAARVAGLTDSETTTVTERLPHFWHRLQGDGDLQGEIRRRPQSRHLELDPPWPTILTQAGRLLGIPRYLSVHPGGVVITPDPIDTYVPVEKAPKGVPIIQWEKDATEEAGLVKIDLLGNRSLGVIRDAVANIHQNGLAFEENRWEPEDDFVTQEAVAGGHTMGCFYIESPAMRLLQQKAGVGDFEHLVIHSSIIRPAANDCIQEYLRRLHGGDWQPLHPLLADVLDETFGIMVYQEDVSRAAVALAGFSHAEADRLRKVMSKKDREYHLRDFARRFEAGARARGVSDEQIAAVWQMIMSFSGYSFCKPHSASYARVSFQAAYLKIHHPAEFIAAVISNGGGFYSTFAYVSEARRMGLRILPPDVRLSQAHWTGRDRRVRVGLSALKGLSQTTLERILDQRRQQPFQSLNDFCQRVRPDETEARALIHCGALDGFNNGDNRATLLWQLACWQKKRSRRPNLDQLFNAPADNRPPPLPPENSRQRLRREFGVLGFLCDRHPMQLYANQIASWRPVKAVNVARFVGQRIRMAGWLITGKVVSTKTGEPMEFLTFEDETGVVETTFFPRVFKRFCYLIDRGRPYLLSGKVEQNWGATTLTVDGVQPLGHRQAA